MRQKARHQQLGHRQEEVVWKMDVCRRDVQSQLSRWAGEGSALLTPRSDANSEVGSGVPELGEVCQVLSIQGCTVFNVIEKYRRRYCNPCTSDLQHTIMSSQPPEHR